MNIYMNNQATSPTERIFTLPATSSLFAGRTKELDKLAKLLNQGNMVAVCGLAGIGKSELAKQYAHNNRDTYRHLAWLEAETEDSLNQCFRDLAKILNIGVDKNTDIKRNVGIFYESIVKQDNKVIFIFDNALHRQSINAYLPPCKRDGVHIVITTQCTEWGRGVHTLELQPIDEAAALEVFRDAVEDMESSAVHLKQLARHLSYMPLALQLAACYLRQEADGLDPNFSIANYVEKLKKDKKFLDKKFTNDSDLDYQNSIYKSLKITLDRIKKYENDSDAVLYMLYVCVYLNTDGVKDYYLKDIWSKKVSEEKLLNGLRILKKYSLITLEITRFRLIRMHRLVQQVLRFHQEQCDIVDRHLPSAVDVAMAFKGTGHLWSVSDYLVQCVDIVRRCYQESESFKRVINEHGGTWLLEAAGRGYSQLVHVLVRDLNVNINSNHTFGRTALHQVAWCEEEENMITCARLLLQLGALVNTRNNSGMTPLHWAADRKQAQLLKMYVEEYKADVNAQDQHGRTALHLIVQWPNNTMLDCARLLMECGASPNVRDNEGRTPLYKAAELGHSELVRLCVDEYKGDINLQDNNASTPLHLASSCTDKNNAVQWSYILLQAGASVNARNRIGRIPLHLAALNGNINLVRLFVDKYKPDVNAQDKDGYTPLHLTAWCEVNNAAVECARLILQFGGLINLKDMTGSTPLHLATLKGISNLVQVYVNEYKFDINCKRADGRTPLHLTAFCDDDDKAVECAFSLLQLGAFLNAKENEGNAPLHFAAREGKSQLVQLLVVEYKSDVNQQSNDGYTPLHLTTLCDEEVNAVECARMLLQLGANIDLTDNDGETPLHFSARKGKSQLVQLQVGEYKSDVNHQSNDGYTPLHLTALCNEEVNAVECARTLLQLGAIVDLTNKNGETSVHWSAQQGKPQLVQLLVGEYKSDVNHQNAYGFTPLHLTALCDEEVNAVECAHTLLQLGAIVDLTDTDGKTPLHKAAENGKSQLVQLLVVEYKSDVNHHRNDGCTPLHVTALCDNDVNAVECARTLLQLGAIVDLTNKNGETPVHLSAQQGKPQLVQLLVVEYKSDVNYQNAYGFTPLHLTALCDDDVNATQCARPLLKQGAFVDAKDKEDRTPLHYAAFKGKHQLVQLLVLEYKSDVNHQSNDGCTPLHLTAMCDKEVNTVECARMLLQLGANIDLTDNDGETPLHFSARKGKSQLVQLLVGEYKSDVNQQSNDRYTPLHLTTLCDEEVNAVECARMLLQLGANIDLTDNEGETPLHFSARKGKFQLVQLLVGEYKSDVNHQSNDGYTPLHLTALCNEDVNAVECARTLLQLGAIVDLTNTDGKTPLHKAAENGKSQLVQLLVVEYKSDVNHQRSDGCTPLHVTALCDDDVNAVECARTLLQLGAIVDLTNKNGETPVHWSAQQGKPQLVQLLVGEYKSDVNHHRNDGCTPLHVTALCDNDVNAVECARTLLQLGAIVDLTNKNGETPVHLSAQQGKPQLVQLLVVEYKSDVNHQNANGFTPLHLTVLCDEDVNATKCARTLLKQGAFVDAKDKEDMTPLHYAAFKGQHQLVQLLVLEYKSDVNHQSNDGCTPLHLTAMCDKEVNRVECAHSLLKLGAFVNAKENEGKAPLHFAARDGKSQLVKLFVLEYKSDVNHQSNDGYTPLHLTALCNEEVNAVECARTLLQLGAIVDLTDNDGETPVHWSARNGKSQLVQLLVGEYKSDVNHQSNDGYTPLHLTAMCNEDVNAVECARTLLQLSAIVDLTDTDGETPLHKAAENGKSQLVQLLVKYK